MKNISELIKESASINESRDAVFRVCFGDLEGKDGLPVDATITVSKDNAKVMADWLNSMEGEIFEHADGPDCSY